jgi:hypothetical protein
MLRLPITLAVFVPTKVAGTSHLRHARHPFGSETADGSHYRDEDSDDSEIADGSNYRDAPQAWV